MRDVDVDIYIYIYSTTILEIISEGAYNHQPTQNSMEQN